MSKRSSVPASAPGVSQQEAPHTGSKSADKQVRLLAQDDGHFSMVRALHLADAVTALNGFCGIMSIFSSMRYCLGDPSNTGPIYAALAFIPFGFFFDVMDGKVARWRHKSSLMGQELDSLADLLSFGASPAAAAFALGLRTPLDHIILAFYVLCGLMRLARFNVTVQALPKDASGKSKYFEGLPIPSSIGTAALMAFCVSQGWVGEGGVPGGVWGEGWTAVHPIALYFVGHGCLMVSKTLRVPKL